MHLCQCLRPTRIYNKYAHEFQYVPCGKCEACRNARAAYWTQRLTMERKCWKYCLFVTLTYAPDKRPCFTADLSNRVFVGDPRRFNPDESVPVYDIDMLYREDNSSEDFRSRNDKWLGNLRDEGYRLPHLSRYDCQLFIKRLRKNLKSLVRKKYGKSEVVCQDYLVRYFLAGEYGPTTFVPHYHCLFFFSSEKEAATIQEAVFASWKYGIVNSSFVAGNNASYVASYVNSFASLPLLLQQRAVRPFFLCSKTPTIGSLIYDSSEIREIFDAAAPTFVLPASNGKTYVDIPLWRSFKDSLYPKLAFFDCFNHYERALLYRAVFRIEEYAGQFYGCSDFVNYVLTCYNFGLKNRFFCDTYVRYIECFLHEDLKNDKSKLYDFLVRWYYVSNRVYHQSVVFGISISDYLERIEKFYDNCEREKLRKYFDWLSVYVDENPVQSTVGCDLEFLRSMILLDKDLVTSRELDILRSYGIDVDKFFSDDVSVSLPYIERLIPENQKDFLAWYEKNRSDARNRVKNKQKNDYLEKQNDPLLYALADY